ncbi:MAG: PilZ domain-containing protein [Acidobacteriia bacterium]|nr:PilZ domain-containing protein [Terriglobia bacterium]
MDAPNTKLASARAFIRSLNILLKYARLYGFDHARTAEQFETAWTELHAAIPVTNESGLLLSASGSQLLLDGMPIEATPAERSFAQLLSAAGLASIQFTSRVTKQDLERLVRAFPTQNTKPVVLAERLKTALAGVPGIRINEIRFVAEDASMGEARVAGLLTAQTLGVDAGSMKDWLSDPQKLLQLIAAADGSRRGPGSGPGDGERHGEGSGGNSSGHGTGGFGDGSGGWGSGPRTGSGHGSGPGFGAAQGSGAGSDAGSGTDAGSATGSGSDFGPGTGSGPGSGTGAGPGFGLGSGGGHADAGSGFVGSGGGDGPGTGGAGFAGSGIGGNGTGLTQFGVPVAGSGPARGTETGGHGTGGAGGSGRVGSSGSPGGFGGPSDTGSGFSAWSAKDEDILGILKLLTHLGHTVAGEGAAAQPGPLQEELNRLPAQSQEMLRQALAAVAAQAPVANSKDPMLLRLAEHLAVRFALERYERGEVKVNAVRQMIERMSQEIEGLRKILGAHEEKLASAGIIVESNAELLDRQFWASVPEKGKRAVLASSDAWCIPGRNLKQYVEELIARGDEKTALAILQNYAACLQSPEDEARRRTAIGLADLADVYALLGGRPLAPAIQVAGAQLSIERDDNLQGLISAAFVRLAQEAGARRIFPAILQALDSLDAVEHQRPVFAQNLRPRIGLEKRVPEFLEGVLRGDHGIEGLEMLLQRVPRSTAENLILRFNRTGNRDEMQRLADLAHAVGNDVAASLRDTLRTGSATEAAETTGLLSRLDPLAIERWVPERLADWPRHAQDRMIRLLAMSGAPERGNLLCGFLHHLDPVLLSLAVDEIGLSGDAGCAPALLRLAEGDMGRTTGQFIRLKAVENLGRLKAGEAADLLKSIAEGRHMFHWTYPVELRLAAVQSLLKIEPDWAKDFLPRCGFTPTELSLAPLDPSPNAKYFRRRRYPRIRLSQPIAAIATTGQDSYRLEVRGLSLSGGIAVGEKHLQPGTLVSMKIGSHLRPIRAQVLMRDARAQGLGFEFADMELDERARLRKLLLENRPSSPISSEQEVVVPTSV